MLDKFGFTLVLDFGGIFGGILWFFGACIVICLVGSIIKHFYEKLTEPETEEQKQKRLKMLEEQKKAKKMEFGNPKLLIILPIAVAICSLLLWLVFSL